MGKSFKGFSKALSIILAAAMIFGSVPTPAFAAELIADESEDILISNDTLVEDSSDVLVDASASEEKSSSLIDTQKEADVLAPKENTAGEEDFGPDRATDDVEITIVNTGATAGAPGTADPGSSTHAYVLDPEKNNYAFASGDTNEWDSSKNYVVEILPATGYSIDTEAANPVGVKYTKGGVDTPADEGVGFDIDLTEAKATVTIYNGFLKAAKNASADSITLTVNNTITKGATYYLKTVGTTMAATSTALKLSYGTGKTDANAIDFTSFQPSTAPITGFKIFTKYGATGETEITTASTAADDLNNTTKKWYYDTTSHKLYMDASLVNAGYDANKDLTAVAVSECYTISQATTDANCVLQYNLNGVSTYITSTTDYNKDLEITMKSTAVTGRTFTGASYVVTYDDDSTAEGDATFSNPKATIAKSVLDTGAKKAKSVVVTSKTADAVAFTAAEGTTSSWYSTTGAATVASGDDYTFTVKGTTGYKVTDVSYKLGDPTTATATSLGVSDDNSYKIEDVNNKVTIIITATAAGNDVNVSASVASGSGALATDYTVVDKNTGTSLASAGQFAKKGADYEFIVKEVSHNFSIKEIKYTLGGAPDEYEGIVPVNAAKGVYKIPGTLITTESPIGIVIHSYEMVKVEVPDNTKAILSVGNTAKEDDFYIKKGETFTFSIAGKTDNVAIEQVKYTISGVSTTPVAAASYSIDGSKVTDNITVEVKTTETATGFSVKFTADTNSNYGWTTDAVPTQIKTPTDTNKILNIARGDTTVITPVITDSEGSAVTIVNTDTITYEQSSELVGTKKIANIARTSSSTITASIVATQIGTEVMKYSFTDVTAGDDANSVVYAGTLSLEVKPAVTIELSSAGSATTVVADSAFATKAGTDAKVDYAKWNIAGKRLTVTAAVKNTVTHADVTPAAANVTWKASGTGFYITKGNETKNEAGDATEALTNGQLDARIAASAASETAGTFNVEVKDTTTDGDGNDVIYTAATPLSIFAVEDKNYGAAVTVKLAGGNELFTVTGTPGAVTMDAEAVKTATIDYKVYELPAGASMGTYDTQTKIDTALAADTIKEVTPSYTMSYYKTGDTETVPATTAFEIAGSNGSYSATAKDAVGYTVDLEVKATINMVEVSVPVITFTANATANKIEIPLQIDDGATALALNKTGYLKGKNYSDGYKKDETDGYLFKIPANTAFTLPLESDFDTTKYTDTKKKLVGWAVTTNSAGDIANTTAALTDEYYMPGQSFVALATIKAVTPIWGDRYSVAASGLFRDYGATQSVTITTDSLENNVPKTTTDTVTVAKNDVALTGHATIPLNANAKLGANVTAARTNAVSGTKEVNTNTIYPAIGTGNGTIQWKAYDTTSTGSALDVTDPANATAISTLTVLDSRALANGYLKPAKERYAFVYYEYKDELGNVYSLNTNAIKVTVSSDSTAYVIDLSKLPDEIEVGETIATTGSNGVKVYKDTVPYTSTVGSELDTFEYTVGNGLEIAEFSTGDVRNNPKITGKAAGAQTVSLKITDFDGVEATSTTAKTITVGAAAVNINLVDKTGAATTIVPLVERGGTATSLYVTATNAEGNTVAGTFTYTSSDASVLDNGGSFAGISGHPEIQQLTGVAGTTLGTTKITVTFTATSSSKKYTKEIDLKSYATLTFDRSKAVAVTDGSATLTGAGYVSGEIANMVVSGAGGEAAANEKDYILKLFAEDFDENGDCALSLSPFTVAYTGTNGMEFAGWTDVDTTTPTATTLANVKTSVDLTKAAFEAANYLIAPQFKDPAITTINTSVSTVAIDNLDAAAKTAQVVEISTTPKTSEATLKAKSDVSNTGVTDAFFVWDDDDDITGAGSSDELTFDIAGSDATGSVRKYNMIVGIVNDRVGTATLTVSATGSTVTKNIALNIYGQYKDTAGKARYRKADGTDAVDTAVTVNNVTRFYDEDGYLITKAGTAHDADGNLVLLAAGTPATLVTTDGFHASADAEGNDYFTKDGIVQTGLIEVDGVQRYANTKGILITYEMTEKLKTPGKYIDPETNIAYEITKGTNAAKLDKKNVNAKFTWKTTKPSKFEKNSPLPTNEFEITYNVEGDTEKKTATGTVTAVADPADYRTIVGLTELTFTFTPSEADIAGFFSDDKGEKALVVEPEVWTFKFKNGSSTSTSEGIGVEGLEEEYPFTGQAIKPAFIVVDYEADKVLVEKTDYTVKFTNNKKLNDTATITITGKGNYDKQTITRQFKIVDPTEGEELTVKSVKGVKASKDGYTYDGTAKYPKSLEIKTDAGTITATLNSANEYDLPEGTTVAINVTENVNKGSGIVSVTGSDKVAKSAKFTIGAADMATLGDALTITPEAAVYTKAGAKAAVAVEFNGEDLVEGRDYTLAWKYPNKKNAGTSAGSVEVKGKNNFKGKAAAVTFDIEALPLSEENIIVDAVEKVKVKSLKAKVFDGNGDEVGNKFYSIVKVEKAGEALDPGYKLAAGDEITVTVKGDGKNVEDTEVDVDVKVGAKLSGAKFTGMTPKTYTGEPVELDSEDLEKITGSVKINKVATTLKAGEDFEVVGYKNNNKAGKMTVFVRGIGDKVSGSGKFTVEIKAKPVKDADK